MKMKIYKFGAVLLSIFMTFSVLPVAQASGYEIIGNSQIARAPIGKTAAAIYKIPGLDNVKWSVSGAPSGVVMTEEGALLVPGETVLSGNNLEITVIARDTDGTLLAEKTVDMLNKINYDVSTANFNYVDFPKRAYVNFEIQDVDTQPKDRLIVNLNWDEVPVRFSAPNREEFGAAVIKQEENGNKYVSAKGTKNWSRNGANFSSYLKFTPETSVCYSARFMIEDNEGRGEPFSLIFIDSTGREYDIRYKPESETETGLYLYMKNGESVTPSLLTIVEAGKWFDLWINFDMVNGTLDMYIEDKLVIDGGDYGFPIDSNFRVGAAVDDITYFSGEYAPASFPDTLPEKVFLTESMNKAVLELDNSMLYGKYSAKDKAEHEIIEANGAYVEEDKFYIPAGSGDVSVYSKEIKPDFSKVTADDTAEYALTIQTPPSYGIDTTRTISRQEGIELSYDDEEGGVLDATSLPAEYALGDATGKLMLSFDYMGDFNVMLSDGAMYDTISASSKVAFTEAQIFIDTVNGEYKTFIGGALENEGDITLDSLANVSLSGMKLDNFIFSSVNPTKPYAINPVISGINAVGQTLSADYGFYSPWGDKMKSAEIKWLAADSADGTYTQVAVGESFTPSDSLAGKHLKYSITVSDSNTKGVTIESAPIFVKDVYAVSMAEDNLNVTVQNVIGADSAIIGAMLYNGDEVSTVLNKIELAGESVNWSVPLNGASGATVSLMYEDTLLPVTTSKSVGTTVGEIGSDAGAGEAKVEDGKLTFKTSANTTSTIIIYGNKQSESEFTDKYSKIYSKEEVLLEAQSANVYDKLVYVNVINTDAQGAASITLPGLDSGSYRVEIIPRGATALSCLHLEDGASLFVKEKMDLEGFADVLKLYSDKEDSKVLEIYGLYKELVNKANLEKILKAEDYDIGMFDATTLVLNYLENPDDKDINKLLIDELEAKEKETVGAELLALDAESGVTAEVILESDWKDYDSLLDSLYENAVLYGISHVKNYMEADEFLKTLTDTDYSSSKYQSKICSHVAGKFYDSLEELKEEVDGWEPKEDKKGGSSSGGGGGGGKINTKVDVQISGNVSVAKATFTDVSENHWANEAICYLSERKIVSGNPDGSFLPEKAITRAEFVKIICEAFSLSTNEKISFADVADDSWFAKYCSAAGAMGIVKGDGENFRPNDEITREDAAVIIYRVLEYRKVEMAEQGRSFADSEKISEYAKDSVETLAFMGLISGMEDNSFSPKNQMTKAQCAQIVANCLRGYGL